MALSETRIVLFEKAGFKTNFHICLDEIETQIINSKKGGNPCVFTSRVWTRHKLIQKILNQNGYTVTERENNLETKISWD